MKKIYFVLFVSLLFNLFIGCASTATNKGGRPNLSDDPDYYQTSDIYGICYEKLTEQEREEAKELFWSSERWPIDYCANNPKDSIFSILFDVRKTLGKQYSTQLSFVLIKEKFFEILNKDEVTAEDINKITWIDTDFNDWGYSKYGDPSSWCDELKEDGHENLTLKIINTSNKVLKLAIHIKPSREWFALEIPPHEEKWFTIQNISDVTFLSMNGQKYSMPFYIGYEYRNYTYEKFIKYLFSHYSLEYTYDESTFKVDRYGDHYTSSYKFIKRNNNEENILTPISDAEVFSILQDSNRK